MLIKRGDIYMADLSPVVGSEQGGVRPVVIIQNDTGNKYSPTVIAAAVTSVTTKNKLPTHIPLKGSDGSVGRDSIILAEQIRTIDKMRLVKYIGTVPESKMAEVDLALSVSLGFFAGEQGL
ncbi:type II toxin-antitoxin system PemK/MazF family toxin [Eubacteriales bacterium OttesenSCG-928-M02]|nr:type II toxin-antitoxin system PemK/MazF family toxin [Eubacteriales bacterium OttesenSCG-928-M02]